MNQTEQNGAPRRRAVRHASVNQAAVPRAEASKVPVRASRTTSLQTQRNLPVQAPNTSPVPASRKRRATAPAHKTPKPTEYKVDNTALSSLVKAIIYIITVLIVAGTCSYFGITAGNDIFAFKKSDELVEIAVPSDLTVKQLAEILYRHRVIRYPEVFEFYAKLRKKDSGFIRTTETVSPSMSYDELLAAFKEKPKTPETIRVTVPEGYTIDEIIDLFVDEYGVGTREGFEEAIQNYPFDYWFVKELDEAELRAGRKWRLEGYLYPDTYYFYTTSSEVTIINKFLANFESKIDKAFIEKTKELGWTFDDVIILASMIQMEPKYESDYGPVSSVFHNRLNSNKTQGKLESCATVQYAMGIRSEEVTNEMLEFDSPYNTYIYQGLPPGPITNPTLYAINYALFPADTDYFYFNSRVGGYTLFAKTYSEHLKNVERADYEKVYGTLPDW